MPADCPNLTCRAAHPPSDAGREVEPEAGQAVVRLRLLATTDLHAHILPWDHHTDRPAEARGLARVARLIDVARAEAPQSLLLDNGDFLHGSALGDHWASIAPRRRRPHPMIVAMNRLGYDAATLGNHEFSRGIGFLCAALEGARFPLVSANAHLKRRRLVAPWVLLPRRWRDTCGQEHPLSIGIIGFLPPLTTVWERGVLRGGLTVEDILTAARREVPRLRAAGADLVIALSHSGIEPEHRAPAPGGESVSRALAAVSGIDAIIAGHTHETFPKAGGGIGIAGKPAVMPGFFGSHLGVVDLDLIRAERGWRVLSHRAELRGIAGPVTTGAGAAAGHSSSDRSAPDQPAPVAPNLLATAHDDLVALTATDHAVLTQRNAEVMGRTAVLLSTRFAFVAPSEALALIASAKAARLRAALADGPLADLPLLAAVAPFKCGGRGGVENYTHIPPGPLTLRHAADLCIHPNMLVGLRLTGAQVALWLERSVSLFRQIMPGGRDQPLIDAEFPSSHFDMVHGLRYRVDLSQPPRFDATGREVNPEAQRIRDLTLASGVPLGPKDRVVLATHNYRASGGAGFAGTGQRANVVFTGKERVRDLIADHIRSGQGTHLRAGWSFVPMPGASVIFSGAASEMLPQAVEPLGPEPEGFMRFRLTL